MIKIDYKIENKLIKKLLEDENIQKLEKRKLTQKLFFFKKDFADVYFFSGKINKGDEAKLINAKLVVVNSNKLKEKLLKQFKLDSSKISILYPSITKKTFQSKNKEIFFEKYNIPLDYKVVFFTAKDFKKSGIKEFLELIKSIHYKYVQFIIAGNKKDISNLKFLTSKSDIKDKIIYLEDFKNIDLLFFICDIFVLPTQKTAFATSILKAMYYKSAVFVPSSNSASEVVDVFATMNRYDDGSTPFKVDALLGRKEDLDLIKNDNFNIAKEFTFDKSLKKIKSILHNV
ncbi:glycosyltransferase [Arcobacter sp. CECT 8985]|uniref:glycosyltransferase n=1 Tax=Arcobacter sp. CECT 8985 TaxID=1935424 RepID=UPI00100C33B3|nr:glycosyltransferase [Arcobacter sp. CECT 8985]RXJ87177.1 hypothetical protein CRU93_05415 [Arcobacter sp. CECT 8985]